MADKKQKRNFMCTINFKSNQTEDPLLFLPDFTKLNWLQRVSFQLERGDKSNLLHWQVFLENKYPVSILKMGADFKEMGKKIKICEPDKESHRCAGRNYVKKGNEIDGHRYIWSREGGWEDHVSPIIPVSLPSKTFAIDSKANARKAVYMTFMETRNYILKGQNKSASI